MNGTSQPTRVLLVEDEAEIARLVEYQLVRKGYRVTTAFDGAAALNAVKKELPDLIVLDRMLPGVSGDDVLKSLRSNPATQDVPVLILTARREETDRIRGLELGADDYLAKPFSPRELVLRVEAVLRRARGDLHGESGGQILKDGGITVDLGALRVTVRGKETQLTPTELRLLQILMKGRGRTKSRQELVAEVRNVRLDVARRIRSRAMDMHIRRLRRKLGSEGERIETVRGFGYRFRTAGREGA